MEYGYVQCGTDQFSKNAKKIFRWNSDINRVNDSSVRSIEDLINYLDTASNIIKPIEKIHIVTHGNEYSWIKLDIYSGTHFNSGRSFDRNYGSYKIDTLTLRENSPGGTVSPISVDFWGCGIGQSKKFVQTLKQEFGSNTITAPLHFHNLKTTGPKKKPNGVIEYFTYQTFKIETLKPVRKREDLVKLFDEHKFKYIDGETDVPKRVWKKHLPKYIPLGEWKKRKWQEIKIGDYTNFPDKLTFRKEELSRHEIIRVDLKLISGWQLMFDESVDMDYESKKAKIRFFLENATAEDRGFYNESYLFPEYKLYGYETMTEFMEGFNWIAKKQKKAGRIKKIAKGVRHDYYVTPIIVNPDDNLPYFNYYPSPGSPYSYIKRFDRFNSKLFLRL